MKGHNRQRYLTEAQPNQLIKAVITGAGNEDLTGVVQDAPVQHGAQVMPLDVGVL